MTRRSILVLPALPATTINHGYPTASRSAAITQAETYKHKDGTLVAVAECGKREFDGVPLYCAVRYTCERCRNTGKIQHPGVRTCPYDAGSWGYCDCAAGIAIRQEEKL
jgi:hypothetical protein